MCLTQIGAKKTVLKLIPFKYYKKEQIKHVSIKKSYLFKPII